MNVFELFAKLGLDSSEYEKGLKEAENHGKTFGGRLGSALGTAAKAAGVALTAAATAVVGFGASSVKSGMEFDAAMQKVRAISGANNEQFIQLRDTAQEMGATTKFSATEAANAMEYMAMAGWKTEDMLGGISGIMNLAAASGEDLATTSDIVTDALTAFGMQAGESSHFADILAAAATNSNTNVGMMGETFKYVAPVAGALGYTAEDVAVAIGLMANSGIKASQAGTSLRGLFTRLAKEPKEAAQAMKVLGVSLDDGAGNMYSFREVMQQLRTSFNQNLQIPASEVRGELERLNAKLEEGTITQSEYDKEVETLTKRAYGAEGALKAQYAAMLAGTNGMSGLLAIVNSSDEDWAKLTETIDGCSDVFVKTADGSIMSMNQALAEGLTWTEEYIGASEAIATMMEDTLQGDITSLKSAFEGLQIAVSDKLTPSFREFVQFARDGIRALTVAFKQDGLQGAIDALGPTIERGVELLISVAPKVIEVAMLLLISFVNAIAQNLDKIIPAAIALVMTFGKGIIDALPTIRDGILAGIMALLDSLGLGDVVRDFLENISGPVQEALEKIRSTASAAFERIRAALEPLIQRFKEYVGSGQAMADVSNVAATVIDVLATVISKMIEFVAGAVEKGAAFVEWLTSGSTSAETFKTVLAAVVGGVVAFIAEFKVLNAVTQAAHAIFGALPAVISLLTSPITLVIAAVAALAAGFVYLYNTNETFKNFVDTAWVTIKEVIVGAIENIKAGLQALGEFFAPLIESIKGFLSALIEFAKSAASAIGDYLKSFYESHKTQIDAFFTTVKAIVTGAIDLIKGILTTAFTYIRDAVKGTIDVVTGILNTLSALLKGDFKGAWDAAKETIVTFKDNVIETITHLGENIGKALGELAEHALDWGKNILTNFINGIKEKWNDLTEAVSGVAQKIKDFLGFSKPKEGPLSDADTYGGDFIQLLIDGMKGKEGDLRSSLITLAGNIVSDIQTGWENVKTLGSNFIENIKGGVAERAEGLVSGAKEVAGKSIETISNAWVTAKTLGSNLIERIKGGTAEKAESLISGAGQVASKTGEVISKAWEGAKTVGANLMARLHNGMGEGSTALGEAAVKNATNVRDAFSKGWENVKQLGSNLITNIRNGIAGGSGELNQTSGTAAKNARDSVSNTWNSAQTIGENFIKLLNNGVAAGASVINDVAAKIADNVKNIFVRSWDAAKDLGSNLLSKISSGIGDQMSTFEGMFTRIGESVKNFFTRLAESSVSYGKAIISSVMSGVSQSAGNIGNSFRQIAEAIANAFRNLVSSARSWGSGLIAEFCNGIVSRFNDMVSTINQMASAVRERLHFTEPDKGPLSDFSTYAPDMMKTFAQGIRDNERLVTNQIEKSFDFGSMIGSSFGNGTVVATSGSNNSTERQQPAVLMLDRTILGRVVYDLYNEEAQRVGVKLAGGIV